MSSHSITLHNAAQAKTVLDRLYQWMRPRLGETRPALLLTIGEETRSTDQNALLHALIGEIAREKDWAGRKRSIEVWKRLLVASWLRARGESVEILPALDGHGIDVVFRATSKLTKGECAELVTYVQAWAAQNGIEVSQ